MLTSSEEVLSAAIVDQVPIDSRVTSFRVISVELLSSDVIRSRRSQDLLEYLATFEISLTSGESAGVVDELNNIFENIEEFKPYSVVITDQKVSNEEGKFRNSFSRTKIFRCSIRRARYKSRSNQ